MSITRFRSAGYYADEIETALHRALRPSVLAAAIGAFPDAPTDGHPTLDYETICLVRDDLDASLAAFGVTVPRANHAARGKPVLGWDVTLGAPKSLSVAFAWSPLTDAVWEAHGRGIEVATDWLVTHAARGRVRDPETHEHVAVPITPLALVEVRHLRNRLDEPHLHSHVLWWRDGLDADGKRRALHSPWLYRNHEAARQIALAVTRRTLYETDPEHVRFVRDTKGTLQLAGVPDIVLDAATARLTQVDAETARLFGGDPAHFAATHPGLFWRVRQRVVMATRRAKHALSNDELRDFWGELLEQERKELLWNSITNTAATLEVDDLLADLARLAEHVRAELATKPTFTTEDLVAAVARSSPYGLPADPVAIDRIVAEVGERLGITRVEPALDPAPAPTDTVASVLATSANPILAKLRDRYALPETLDAEARVLNWFAATNDSVVIDEHFVDDALAAHTWLSDEQREAVRVAARGARNATLIRGRAGAGKTAALQVLAEAARAAGVDVLALGYTGRAAVELTRAGVGTASTVDAWLIARRLGRAEPITRPTLVVLDEASTMPTRAFDELVAALEGTPARLVAVGDHRQFAAVEAGGLFAAAWHARRAAGDDDIALLTRNMRQRDPHLRQVVTALERGSPERAIDLLVASRDVILDDDAARLAAKTLAVWLAERERGADVALLTVSREHAIELGLLAHQILVERGELGTKAVLVPPSRTKPDVPEREYRVGEQIVLLHRQHLAALDTRLPPVTVPTSTVLRIVGFSDDGDAFITTDDDDTVYRLPKTAMQDETTYAWAMTAYRSQGATVGTKERRGVVVLYRPEVANPSLGWVAGTRPRDRLVLCVLGKPEEHVLDELESYEQLVARQDNPPVRPSADAVRSLVADLREEEAPTVTEVLIPEVSPALDALALSLRPRAVEDDAAASDMRQQLERAARLALLVPRPVLVGLDESLGVLAERFAALPEHSSAELDGVLGDVLVALRARLGSVATPDARMVGTLQRFAAMVEALSTDNTEVAFLALQELGEDLLGVKRWRLAVRTLVQDPDQLNDLALRLVDAVLAEGVGLVTSELGYEWPREHAVLSLAIELAGPALTLPRAEELARLANLDPEAAQNAWIATMVAHRSTRDVPRYHELRNALFEWAAANADAFDEADAPVPVAFDDDLLTDEPPIDDWVVAGAEGRVIENTPDVVEDVEPLIAPFSPVTPPARVEDADLAAQRAAAQAILDQLEPMDRARLILLGPTVVREMVASIGPEATLLDLADRMRDPSSSVWTGAATRARLEEISHIAGVERFIHAPQILMVQQQLLAGHPSPFVPPIPVTPAPPSAPTPTPEPTPPSAPPRIDEPRFPRSPLFDFEPDESPASPDPKPPTPRPRKPKL